MRPLRERSRPTRARAAALALAALAPALAILACPTAATAWHWQVDDHGWLVVAAAGDSVVLMEGPVEPGRPDVDVAHLAAGTEVVVVETHTLATGAELRVRPADAAEPLGWIPETSLSPAPPATSPADAVPVQAAPPESVAGVESGPPPTPTGHAGTGRWGLQTVLAGGAFGNAPLQDEFRQLGFHGEIGARRFERAGWLWGPSLGIWSYNGNAETRHTTPAGVDVPGASDLVMGALSLVVGQESDLAGFAGFDWSAGPALFYAHEGSDVTTFDAVTQDPLGERDETLGRWTFGGVAHVALGWRLEPRVRAGVQVDAFVVRWDGREEKSLTTDFLHEPLTGVDLGLFLTFRP